MGLGDTSVDEIRTHLPSVEWGTDLTSGKTTRHLWGPTGKPREQTASRLDLGHLSAPGQRQVWSSHQSQFGILVKYVLCCKLFLILHSKTIHL